MKKEATLNVRITTQTHEELKAAATADGRSVSNYVQRVITKHLEERRTKQ